LISDISFLGPITQLQVKMSESEQVTMVATSDGVGQRKVGDRIWLDVSATELFVAGD
jgi:predicted Zn-dependent protease